MAELLRRGAPITHRFGNFLATSCLFFYHCLNVVYLADPLKNISHSKYAQRNREAFACYFYKAAAVYLRAASAHLLTASCAVTYARNNFRQRSRVKLVEINILMMIFTKAYVRILITKYCEFILLRILFIFLNGFFFVKVEHKNTLIGIRII